MKKRARIPTPITDALAAKIESNLDPFWKLNQMLQLAQSFERSAELLRRRLAKRFTP